MGKPHQIQCFVVFYYHFITKSLHIYKYTYIYIYLYLYIYIERERYACNRYRHIYHRDGKFHRKPHRQVNGRMPVVPHIKSRGKVGNFAGKLKGCAGCAAQK